MNFIFKNIITPGSLWQVLDYQALNNAGNKFDIANKHESLDELNSICWGTLCFSTIFHDCGTNAVSKIINCSGSSRGLECARNKTQGCFPQTQTNSFIKQMYLIYGSKIKIHLQELFRFRLEIPHYYVTTKNRIWTRFIIFNNCQSSLLTDSFWCSATAKGYQLSARTTVEWFMEHIPKINCCINLKISISICYFAKQILIFQNNWLIMWKSHT